MNIINLLNEIEEVTLSIKGSDLKEFGRHLIIAAQKEAEEKLKISNEDKLLTIEEAMALLKIKSRVTLWRWEKIGYLVPIRSGKRCLYRKSDIEHLLTNSIN